MASSSRVQYLILIALLVHTASISPIHAQIDHAAFHLITEPLDLDWPAPSTISVQNELSIVIGDDEEDLDTGAAIDRRSLNWIPRRYYISYGALSANRIPCPARCGRSYYTNNCFGASGPVRPYTRGCSSITRCRR
ncbi:hypothetical protein U1Q18_005623 [Sarracenia purpurea var. burkii]